MEMLMTDLILNLSGDLGLISVISYAYICSFHTHKKLGMHSLG